MRSVRIATRGSLLALTQTGLVARALEAAHPGLEVELVPLRVAGDERGTGAGVPLAAPVVEHGPGEVPEDKSRWVLEIEEALLAGRADVAVHSAKDVPGELAEGLALIATPAREDPRDVLCGAESVEALPAGARVGTSSLRRRAQLLAVRPDLVIEDLRGNVDTRLRKLAEGRHDAIVLARAGLVRLGRSDGAPIPLEVMIPAPGQGCLVLEARAGDEEVREVCAALDDPAASAALAAERALVGALEASCRTPVGAHARVAEEGDRLELASFVGLPDGSAWLRDAVQGGAEEPAGLGREAAERLFGAGAGELLREAEGRENQQTTP